MKTQRWKKWLAAALAAGMLAANCLSAAAGSLEDHFDAGFYSSEYEDLQQAFGSNEEQLLDHYLTYGLQEGRNAVPYLNLVKYREAYKDLEKAFGNDWSAYLNHYLTLGAKEGRSSFADFDAAAYAERYPDLLEAFGLDVERLYHHWLEFGKNEGRNAGRPADIYSDSESFSTGEGSDAGEEPDGGEGDVSDGDDSEGGEASKEDPLMTLNEDGYFAEAFCRTLDLDAPAEWSDMAMLFYINLTEESKEALSHVKTVGDVYEYGSVTFYPNGFMEMAYKFKDEVYDIFTERELFAGYYPEKEVKREQSYVVNKEEGKVFLMPDATALGLDTATVCITHSVLLKAENYRIPGVVEGDGSQLEKNYTLLSNVSYGEDNLNTMDVFVPQNLDTSKANGAIILIYGGGWTGGNKEATWGLAQQYAESGYVAVSINMRNCYHDEATGKTLINVYDMLNDVQGSVIKLKSLSDENGWNITQCATKGFSSGGNIALLYAYSRGTDVPYFDTREILPVRFVADVVGPVDMHEEAWYGDEEWPVEDKSVATTPGAGPIYAMLLTGAVNKGELTDEELEECINSMSPVWYVENYGGIPTVMGYSARDFIQNPNNGKRLKGYLDAQNIRNDLYSFPNSIHSYAADPELGQAYYDKTLEYAETYFISQ